MQGLEVIFRLLVTVAAWKIIYAELYSKTPSHLGHFDQKQFNRTTNFKLPALRDLSYLIGCVQLEVTSQADFDLQFTADSTAALSDTEPWYYALWSFWKNIWNRSSGKHFTASRCLNPFRDTYIRVKPSNVKPVHLQTSLRRLDLTCCSLLFSGMLLFFLAPKLARSVAFYYSSGVAIGVLASVLIVVFVISRYMPKKQIGYTVLLGGWSICAWIFTYIKRNLMEILLKHYVFLVVYLITTGFLSFAICYRYGPTENHRTYNLIQWSIQLVSILFIYSGTQLPKVSLSLILGILVFKLLDQLNTKHKVHEIARGLKAHQVFKWALGSFGDPEPRRLLTQEEYRLQGETETKKALDELRLFCNSPNCSPWKTVSRLQSPSRFASFIEGDDHIADREITLYEEDMQELSDSEKEEDLISDDETEDVSEADNRKANISMKQEDLISEDDND